MTPPDGTERLRYADAGVDIAAGEKAVELIKAPVRSTFRPEVVGDVGGFGGLFAVDWKRYRDPLLVSSTDIATQSIPIESRRPASRAITDFVPTPSVEDTSSGSR